MKKVNDISGLNSKTVLIRTDMDEPHDGDVLRDDYRIMRALPSLEYLIGHGAKIIILSKIGRPQLSFDPKESLFPAVKRLAELLKKDLVVAETEIPPYSENNVIFFKGDIRKKDNQDMVKSAPQKSIIVLENMRFYHEEENCDQDFAKMLASLGDVYVNDAFAMAHRNEVSVSVLAKIMPAYIGLEMDLELKALDHVMTMNAKPFVVVMGGAKISDKVETIRNLAAEADAILIGGALANLFLLAKGMDIGMSYCESDKVELAAELLRNYKDKIHLPTDAIVSDKDMENISIVSVDSLHPEQGIYDIGPKTILEFSTIIKTAKKMIWNGPLGKFEEKKFSTGTLSIARIFAARCQGFAYGVVGGGDTLEAINAAGIADQIDFVSTGGGAMLEYLAGHNLPAVDALKNSK